jgi:hypothetical protein
MTNEEMQRKMEFIVEQQAQFAVHIQQLEAERIRDRPRLIRLEKRFEESFQRLVALAEITDSRLDKLEESTSRFETKTIALETNMAALVAAQTHADERLSALINIVMEDRGRPS